MNPTKELVKKIYASSKEEVIELISSEELMRFISNTETKFSLNQEQRNSLGAEIASVLLGIMSGEQLIQKSVSIKIPANILEEIHSALEKDLIPKIPKEVWDAQINTAKEILGGPQSTLRSIPEVKTESTSLATGVVVEKHSELPSGGVERPKTNLNFEERKKLVPNIADNKGHYTDKIDPYREPV
jgi:hypothetical protein